MNQFLLETKQIVQVMEPVDLNTAAVTGARVKMAKFDRICILIALGDSTGATVEFTLKQHTAASGGTSKDLAILNPYYKKAGAATIFTKVEPSVAAATYDLSSDFAAEPGLVAFEVLSDQLDVNNGFYWISLNIADSTAAKIGSAVYIMGDERWKPAYEVAP